MNQWLAHLVAGISYDEDTVLAAAAAAGVNNFGGDPSGIPVLDPNLGALAKIHCYWLLLQIGARKLKSKLKLKLKYETLERRREGENNRSMNEKMRFWCLLFLVNFSGSRPKRCVQCQYFDSKIKNMAKVVIVYISLAYATRHVTTLPAPPLLRQWIPFSTFKLLFFFRFQSKASTFTFTVLERYKSWLFY